MALEEIKRRKLEELQRRLEEQQNQALQEQLQLQQQVEILENTVKQYLTKDAITRYHNLKVAHPEKALRVIAIIAQAIQNRQLNEKINDIKFKEILNQLETPKKRFELRKV